MNTFYQNDIINNINIDSAVSQILSYFDPFYIINVIDDSFNMRYRPYNLQMPNLIVAYEERFKMIKDQFPNMTEHCTVKREEIYDLAINRIADFYNLSIKKEFVTTDNQYVLAYSLYQFLIADFTGSLINFFVAYIEKEKDSIYTYLMPMIENNEDVADKSIKNTTMSLNKKTYTNMKIAGIQTYLSYVLDLIATSDVDFETFVRLVVNNQAYANLIITCVEDKGDLFKNYFCSFLVDPDTRPSLITTIKLRIHDIYLDRSKMENYMNKEKR